MSTQRIEQTVQGYTYQRPKKAHDDAEFPLGPEQSKTRQEGEGGSGDTARGRIRSLLNRVDGETGGAISFADVVAYHEAAQSGWNGEVGADLEELGVNVDVPFRLMYDPAGAVAVVGDHPGGEMIDSYFTANPGRVRELGDILHLGRLASAAETRLGRGEMEQPMAVGAMTEWYAANMDPAALFSGGGVLVGAGGTVYRGLDLRV
ncbi:MAG: hypothetical protein H0S80_09890 [Desulfovibrionaceae bacterium]|nr:hypothetical protein [Desulfovibrionaceae bacterium]